jgi:hypothetical protein
MVCLAQSVHLSYTDTNTVSKTDRNKIPPDPHHIVVPSGVSNTIFEPLVRSMQTVHLSCVKITNTSKRTELRFQLSLVTWEYHRACPKWFLSQWDVWRKPCNSLASTLTLSLDRPKWDSTWSTSPRSSTGWKMISKPVVCSVQTTHLSWVKITTISKQTELSFHLSLVT